MRSRLYKVIEHFYPPYSGAKWIRGPRYLDTIALLLIAPQTSIFRPLEFAYINEGETSSSSIMSHRSIEKPLCEKKLAGLLNRLPRTQPSLSQCGSTLELFNWPATAAVYAALRGKVKRKFKLNERGKCLIRWPCSE